MLDAPESCFLYTAITSSIKWIGPKDEIKKFIANRNLLGRFAKPIDIARAILFLASNDSAFMTGSEVVVDGGYTAR